MTAFLSSSFLLQTFPVWVQHFIHHLAPQGMAGFVLANGSMSSSQSGEGTIRQALIEADLVDCMVALPGQLFYSTQILPRRIAFQNDDANCVNRGNGAPTLRSYRIIKIMTLADHSAPGSNAGFSFQFERALYWLAKSSAGSVVGVETNDDVAIRGTDSKQILEQDKHSIQKDVAPFGVRSKDLWNTLKIWIEALDSDEVTAGTTLFMMVTNKDVPECIARKLGHAESEDDINACIADLETAAIAPPKGIRPLVERVMRSESRSNLRELIFSCRFADASEDTAGQELRAKTFGHLQVPECYASSADSILDELLGWMHKTALTSWQQKQPAWIKRDNFVNHLYAILDLRKRLISRERAEHLIPVGDDKVGD